MRSTSLSLILAFLLSVEIITAASTTKTVKCRTKYGSKSVSPVKTSRFTTTKYSNAKTVYTVTPQTTKTPAAVTITLTGTATSTLTSTLSQQTDTFTTLSYLIQSFTLTSTGTGTSYITATSTTTTQRTVTVSTTAGFVPIESSIANSAKKRRNVGGPRDAPVEIAARAQSKVKGSLSNGKPVCSPPIYPSAVTCADIIKVYSTSTVIKTAKTQTKTAPTPTSTTSITITITSTTTTLLVDASFTATSTESIYILYTSYSTTTTVDLSKAIETAYLPDVLIFDQCADNNIITKVGGQPLSNQFVFGGDSHLVDFSYQYSPYDCCAACVSTPNCAGTYGNYVNGGLVTCELLISGGTCSHNFPAFGLSVGSTDNGYFASNGDCGQNYLTS